MHIHWHNVLLTAANYHKYRPCYPFWLSPSASNDCRLPFLSPGRSYLFLQHVSFAGHNLKPPCRDLLLIDKSRGSYRPRVAKTIYPSLPRRANIRRVHVLWWFYLPSDTTFLATHSACSFMTKNTAREWFVFEVFRGSCPGHDCLRLWELGNPSSDKVLPISLYKCWLV